MCGACPGGGRLSEDTRFLAQRLSPARTAQFVAGLTSDRLRIAPLGDGWSVSLPTGSLVTAADFEGLVRHCAPYVCAERLAAAGGGGAGGVADGGASAGDAAAGGGAGDADAADAARSFIVGRFSAALGYSSPNDA